MIFHPSLSLALGPPRHALANRAQETNRKAKARDAGMAAAPRRRGVRGARYFPGAGIATGGAGRVWHYFVFQNNDIQIILIYWASASRQARFIRSPPMSLRPSRALLAALLALSACQRAPLSPGDPA